MPRIAREKSESGFYHVILRGIDQLQLFYDNEDYQLFLDILARNKELHSFTLLAYSLMGNHIHLLVGEHEDGTTVSKLVQCVTTSYARRYNTKYGRSGYLLQGRFKSEAIDSEAYLLEAVRYIHNNPVKIGKPINSYTSYNDYRGGDKATLTDTQTILGMFSKDPTKARKAFMEFLQTAPEETPVAYNLDRHTHPKLTDTEAVTLIKHIAEVENCADLGSVDKGQRDLTLCRLKGEGLSVRRISRLTGINRSIVDRAGKVAE